MKCIDEMGISLRGFKTRAAIKEYNRLIDQGEDVIACLHLTC